MMLLLCFCGHAKLASSTQNPLTFELLSSTETERSTPAGLGEQKLHCCAEPTERLC